MYEIMQKYFNFKLFFKSFAGCHPHVLSSDFVQISLKNTFLPSASCLLNKLEELLLNAWSKIKNEPVNQVKGFWNLNALIG